jgi:hypothetical protein
MYSAFTAAANRSYLITIFCSVVAVLGCLIEIMSNKREGKR